MKYLLTATFILLYFSVDAQEMDYRKLKLILAKEAEIVQETGNAVEYKLNGLNIYLITDENANRMRLMAGIIETDKLALEELSTLMEANFDRALDAKYAISDKILWAVYVHPLKELHEKQVTDALYQVYALVSNYGTTYTSTDMIFGGEN
jgi:hypothetical protein